MEKITVGVIQIILMIIRFWKSVNVFNNQFKIIKLIRYFSGVPKFKSKKDGIFLNLIKKDG